MAISRFIFEFIAPGTVPPEFLDQLDGLQSAIQEVI
jgi:hypothetical protein